MQETPERDPHWNDPVMEGRKFTAGRTDYFLTSSTPIFSRPQIDLLRSLVDAENAPAGIEGYGETTPGDTERQRRTRVRWLNADDYRWVYEVIWAEASRANALFQFDVVPMWDTIQLALYDAAEEGFFRWHADTIPSDLTRKISISVPLSDPGDYAGGILELNSNGAIRRPPQRAGVPIMFPSWMIHRVTPVTVGKRYSLVAWIRGPNWR